LACPSFMYGRDPRDNPVVATILDPDAPRIRYGAAMGVATGRELAAAKRLLPLEIGAWRAARISAAPGAAATPASRTSSTSSQPLRLSAVARRLRSAGPGDSVERRLLYRANEVCG